MNSPKYALISVSDKSGIQELAYALIKQGIHLISTGGTYRVLEEAGLPVQSVDSVTGFPEMMDGRVKTLHPKIHGGLLGLRDNANHMAAMKKHEIQPIDYVIVNLYPFKETILKPEASLADAIENIDIGGPSMLRSAAKNYQSVTVVTDPRDYPTLIDQLNQKGKTSLAFRQYLARKVYQLTAQYDAMISQYLLGQEATAEDFTAYDWSHKTLAYSDSQALRYGENSHQQATFYTSIFAPAYSLAKANQLNGKELSYNNIKDADAAMKIAQEFSDPCAVAVKHMNPCGVAVGSNIEQAFDRCFQADPVSIYGGIVVVNRPVTLELAQKMAGIFLEIIIAPEFEAEALTLLQSKKNLRLLTVDFTSSNGEQEDCVSVAGGLLVQSADVSNELEAHQLDHVPSSWEVMTEAVPSQAELRAMNFGMKVCKYVKSNAIVICNEYMTLGIGAGQMNRVGSAKIAIDAALAKDESLRQTMVMASDAFLPMADTAELAHEAKIDAIAQPGGSVRDQESIDFANQHGMRMMKTHIRHFRH
ncbi:bifunctional phosphoribosylaminoimidazolecarboxamide formyltransferase/IMP cyclohydrolase [Vaginisenegalia massiliensis]|uniref:bifunctional phosphoribosylaminoimidazolecarboxamide formyltransferase/IMP cyclohydrolase n=1 Tax=Vaginisenegalia massiliensis TaxID=2058294 RepID=UPI000F54C607|nr:bifunctional phosphoribosylaminoimidazolecarboxamide formyltransferase/IMP cyclohydrolase [Vaginisenegalia massiliensis]